MFTPTLPTSHHDLLTGATVSLSTLNADGSIQTTAIWVMVDENDVVRTSLAKNRRKYVNLVARPVATLFSISPTNPMHTLEIRATVEIEDDDADLSFLKRLLATYDDSLDALPLMAEEERTVVTFRPTRIRI
ncbi:TIGR03618 family F420-dependent PPOX class oxidoreductase [uncultured Jatrophihabitans sp.]|uniref:TIGR03618 family F420-dependent PPOX class oxidoreductase n=1 Tax=uncultured Jatrophihabitans sp. TaxID=1610747 RepID=UPI0035C947FA